ncbi:phospholipase A [Mangrovitalea sediminis]|uniref:phospholipase A n=1 Tax=Mangrovitalea sediminis TaxID=1982043 RepID=UPI001D0D296A|nr:phospholipase A [Mangrovitalea sediminis]
MKTWTVLPFMLATLSTPLLAAEQAATTDGSAGGEPPPVMLQDCSLITDGVSRLACYDTYFPPQQAQQSASAAKKAEVQKAVSSETDGTDNESLLDNYMKKEKALFSYSGSFLPYRPMYVLPFSYVSNPNQAPFSPQYGSSPYGSELDKQEVKFQISFRMPLLTGYFNDRTTLWLAYTQRSFWQAYNHNYSSPFRETNYEPEFFVRYATNYHIGPGSLDAVTLGIDHQSNGRSDPFSRSWNRITASAAYSTSRWFFAIRPWYRIPENPSNDDNPDIQDYLGYADYIAEWKMRGNQRLSIELHNNLKRENNLTSFELGYSYPLSDSFRVFVQYVNAYGESLIDYNHRIHRFGIGFMLNDWI